eukprot:673299-Amphidinium_carterae.1
MDLGWVCSFLGVSTPPYRQQSSWLRVVGYVGRLPKEGCFVINVNFPQRANLARLLRRVINIFFVHHRNTFGTNAELHSSMRFQTQSTFALSRCGICL